jgi:hypothetical protein
MDFVDPDCSPPLSRDAKPSDLFDHGLSARSFISIVDRQRGYWNVWVRVTFKTFKFAPTHIEADIADKCSRSPDLLFQMESNQAPDLGWRPDNPLIFSFPEPPGAIPGFRLSMRLYLSQTADMIGVLRVRLLRVYRIFK